VHLPTEHQMDREMGDGMFEPCSSHIDTFDLADSWRVADVVGGGTICFHTAEEDDPSSRLSSLPPGACWACLG
jgi:hypothetical protein